MRRGGIEDNITTLSMLGAHRVVKINKVNCAGDIVRRWLCSDGHDYDVVEQ